MATARAQDCCRCLLCCRRCEPVTLSDCYIEQRVRGSFSTFHSRGKQLGHQGAGEMAFLFLPPFCLSLSSNLSQSRSISGLVPPPRCAGHNNQDEEEETAAAEPKASCLKSSPCLPAPRRRRRCRRSATYGVSDVRQKSTQPPPPPPLPRSLKVQSH